MSRADVFGDVSISVTGDTGQRVVRFTDGQEEGSMVTRGKLNDVSDQRRRTQAEDMHPCRETDG